ncbi:hypothetical protein BLS_000047 [Venturia inaequalis]|uniref:Pentatricopeptide repeat protein n=1 Tax=Venturia inaequalis TaxID=5025 RepID=A0A8H3VBV2_VENIN|nr:hypothetical protein EG328_002820 [Venturia inaequalis]KAE9986114.1 hypothetical protein BLS_000047 [Venturia inaequalis]
MLQTPTRPPSTGALRLLRWLALYGSFGTAAGATAFVLEEQRRHICRLSRIRDNGRKLREFMHRRNQTPTSAPTTAHTPSLPDFHDYVQDLETKGVVKREPAAQNGRSRLVGGRQDDYHYEFRARRLPESKSRPKVDNTGKKGTYMLNGSMKAFYRTFSTSNSSSQNRRRSVRRIDSLPPPPSILSVYNNLARTRKHSEDEAPDENSPHKLVEEIKTRKDWQVLIASQSEGLNTDELQSFLLVAARSGHLDTIGALSDTCESQLPWSAHLYPLLLHALDLVAVSVKPLPSNAETMFLLGRRVLAKASINPLGRIQFFHEAGAFPLVLATYQRLPDRNWTSGFMEIILESVLRVAALKTGRSAYDGAELSRLVTDTLHEIPKTGHFFRTFPRLYNQISASPGCRRVFDLTILRSIGYMCRQKSTDMLEAVLKRFACFTISAASFADVAAKIIDGDEPCSEQCYSLLLHHFRASYGGRESILEEKLLELGLQKNFLKILDSFGKDNLIHQSPAITQARVLLDGHERLNFTAEEVNTMVLTLDGHHNQVQQIFRRYFHLKLTNHTLQRCWTAIIHISTEDEIIELLDLIQEQSRSFSSLHLERLRAALVRQTWHCMNNFDQAQKIFAYINKFRSDESKRREAGILSSTMIAICAKAERWEEAKQYVWDARHLDTNAKITLKGAGFHYETILLARKGQWEKVKRNLRFTREQRQEAERIELFLEVLSIFSQQYHSQKVLDFCRWAVTGAGVYPTQRMFDIVISRCLADGDQQLVSRTLAFMKELNVEWQIRAETVVMTFRKYASKYKPRSVQFMQYLEGLQGFPHLFSKDVCLILMERCSVTARRLRFVGRERLHLMQQRSQTKLAEQVTRLETLAATAPWISQKKARSHETGNPSLERAQAYYIKMQVASSLQQWREVVELYEDSLQQSIPRLELSLCLAVTACLKLNDPESGVILVQTARSLGFNTAKAEVMVTSQGGDNSEVCDPDELRKGVLQHYENLQSRFLPLDHGKLVQAAHTLVLKQQAAASVALLSEIYQSSIARMQPFDIVVMTCFLTAYSRAFDVGGIRWTVRTILSKNLLLDIHFFRSLSQARVRICASLTRDGQRKRSKEVYQLFKIWDMVCWRRYEKQQRNVVITGRVMTNMLVRLHMRDSPMNRFLTNRVRVRKLYHRPTARDNFRARHEEMRLVDGDVEGPETKWSGVKKKRMERPLPLVSYAERVDWKEEMQIEPVVPPSIEETADAVSILLDPEMDMATSNDVKVRYEYQIRKC